MGEHYDYLDDDEIVRMDPADDKTGERRKSALIVAGSAIAGAFIGDVFAVREYVMTGEITHISYHADTGAYEFKNVWTFREQDRGGMFDLTGDDGKIAQDMEQARALIEKREADGYFENGLYNFDVKTGTVISETVTYHAEPIVGGFIAGGVGGYAVDRFRRKMKEKRKESLSEQEAKEDWEAPKDG